jgi:hypothetical protein
MSKSFALMRDVITIYHPEFRKSKDLCKYGLKNSNMFNVERLVEESLAAIGPYKFIDGEHMDFDDGTDSKTASIRENPVVRGHNSYAGEIAAVSTAGGGQKSGGLRCTIYNPHWDELLFYFLPKKFWVKNITIHPSSGIGKIMYTYNLQKNYISKLNGYQCSSFEKLAKIAA